VAEELQGQQNKKDERGYQASKKEKEFVLSYERAELLVFAAEKLEKELQNPNTERHDFPAVS